MPVLIVALASVLMLAAIVALAAMAWAAERDYLRRIRFSPLARPFTAIEVREAFDPEHAPLWTTQVAALLLVHSAGRRGLPYPQLYGAFKQAAERFPELYDGSSFAEWLLFLQRAELVVLTPSRVKITAEGRLFLDYMRRSTVAA